jgi:hypothetical protein
MGVIILSIEFEKANCSVHSESTLPAAQNIMFVQYPLLSLKCGIPPLMAVK